MRVYIAASDQMAGRKLRDLLQSAGHTVVSRWLDIEDYVSLSDEGVCNRYASNSNIQEVLESDLLILRSEPDRKFVRGGKHVETGVALALEKPVVVLGQRENVFHWHPLVAVVSNEAELLDVLGQIPTLTSEEPLATPGESEVNDLTKMRFDYAWKWFDFHATQRTTIFNYFMIIVGILANALVVAYKEEYHIFVKLIAVLGSVASVAFIVFDTSKPPPHRIFRGCARRTRE